MCIPSKAMLRPVMAVADARRVAGARQAVTGPVDAPAVFKRRDGHVTDWHDDVTVTGVRPGGSGPVTMTLEGGGEVQADEVLFAAGRQPNTADIGLDIAGLEPGSWLEVDDTCMVRALQDGWLYALGDINHHDLLTHQGKYQARIAASAIAARAAGQPIDTAPWGPQPSRPTLARSRRCSSATPRPPRSG